MRGLYLAEGAMLVQQAQLMVVSNNMANLRTTGFKRDIGVETSFAEWLVHELKPAPLDARGGTLKPLGTMAHNVATQETVTAFFQGPLEVTDRTLDFALVGNGFFQVQGPEDKLYTRNGRFYITNEGVLVTADGYEVLGDGGSITLDPGALEEVVVKSDGAIFAGGTQVAAFDIAVFAEDALIEKFGYNYFTSESAPGGEEDYEVLNGILENSNVSLAREMVSLMVVRRTYEAAQKMMITYDQLLDKACNELGSSV